MFSKAEIKKKCRLAIDNVIKENITDVELFSRPFEVEYLKLNEVRESISEDIACAILLNKFVVAKFSLDTFYNYNFSF